MALRTCVLCRGLHLGRGRCLECDRLDAGVRPVLKRPRTTPLDTGVQLLLDQHCTTPQHATLPQVLESLQMWNSLLSIARAKQQALHRVVSPPSALGCQLSAAAMIPSSRPTSTTTIQPTRRGVSAMPLQMSCPTPSVVAMTRLPSVTSTRTVHPARPGYYAASARDAALVVSMPK